MRVDCYKCGTAYRIPDEAIGDGGVRAECPRCGYQETIRPDRTKIGPAPAPPPGRGSKAAAATAAAPAPRAAPSPPAAAAPRPSSAPAPRPAPAPSPGPMAAQGAAPAGDDREDLFDYSRLPSEAPRANAVVAHDDDDDPFADIDTGAPPPAAAGGAVTVGGSAPAPHGKGASPGSGTGFVHGAPAPTPAEMHLTPREPEYRVKKPDGRVLGPVTYAELETMADTGEIAPGDQVARNDDEFRLISQYEEAAHLLEKAASHYRVRTASAALQGPRRRKWPFVVIGVIVLLLASVAAVGRFAPKAVPKGLRGPLGPLLAFLAPAGPALPPNPVKAQLAAYRLQVPGAKGKAGPSVKRALGLMSKDTLAGYRGADLALKQALVLDPDDPEAIALFVLNTAYLDDWHGGAKTLQVILSYADYLHEAHPKAKRVHLARAVAYLLIGKGQVTEAADEAKAAVDADPKSVAAKIVLARATNAIDTAAARKMIDALQKDAGAYPRVILEQGELCQADGDFVCAERAYRARLAKTPGQQAASNALARLYVLLGRYDDAAQVYRAILKADPDRVDAELDLAVIAYQVQGNLKTAAHALDRLQAHRMSLADDVTAARIRTHAATVDRLQGHLDDAVKLVQKVLSTRPLDGPASYQGALLAILRQDPARARGLIPSVSASLRDTSRLEILRALVAHVSGDDASAEDAARQASAAAPGALRPILLATALEGSLGKPRQAYLLLHKALAIDPADAVRSRPPTDYYDGAVTGKITVEGFQALVKADPEQGLAYAGLGMAQYLAGDTDGAKTSLQKALGLDDQDVPALVYLGEMARETGDLPTARKDFSQAADADHLAPLPQYLLGRIDEAQKRHRDAAIAYERTLRLDPSFHLATVRLALMKAHRGDKAGAKKTLLKVLTLHPNSVEARRALYSVE